MSSIATEFRFDNEAPPLPAVCCGCGGVPSAHRRVSRAYPHPSGFWRLARVDAPYCASCGRTWGRLKASRVLRVLVSVTAGLAAPFALQLVWQWAPFLALWLVAPAATLAVDLALLSLSRRALGARGFPVEVADGSSTHCTVRVHQPEFARAIAEQLGGPGKPLLSVWPPDTLAAFTVPGTALLALFLTTTVSSELVLSSPFEDEGVTWQVEGLGTFEVPSSGARRLRVAPGGVTVRASAGGVQYPAIHVPTALGSEQLVDVDGESCFVEYGVAYDADGVIYDADDDELPPHRLWRTARWHDVRGISFVLEPPSEWVSREARGVHRALRYAPCPDASGEVTR